MHLSHTFQLSWVVMHAQVEDWKENFLPDFLPFNGTCHIIKPAVKSDAVKTATLSSMQLLTSEANGSLFGCVCAQCITKQLLALKFTKQDFSILSRLKLEQICD